VGETAEIILRPLQERAISAVRAALRRVKRVLLVAPTGFGKTATSAVLIKRIADRGKRALFLVHRREIVRDTAKRLRRAGVRCAIVMADEEPPTDETVLICSVQTLHARRVRPPADVIFWDEAHHCAARTYREIAGSYPDAMHIGLTATPERSDGTGLRDMFDEIVIAAQVSELIAEKLLVPCDVTAPGMRQQALAEEPVAAWTTHALGRRAVVFCANTAHATATRDAFRTAGIATGMVLGTTNDDERTATLADFEAGRITVLVNVFVLTEGWDCPPTEVCILARGCGSQAMLIQTVGRVLRIAEGKTRALVIDLCGSVRQHGLPDDHREFSLDGKPIRTKEPVTAIRQCPECGAVFRPSATRQCPMCRFEFPAPELPEVRREALRRVAPGTNAPLDVQLREWERIRGLCRSRGYKSGWAAHAFKAKFGFWPGRNFPRVEVAS
jgi:DNA repair protein RadD